MYWTDKSAYTTSVSLQTSFRTGDVRRPGTITLPMPEFSGDRNYQRHHTCAHSHMHCRPICWRSVWERCCAHSLAQWDVATPALISPEQTAQLDMHLSYLSERKTQRWKHDESKKTGQWHKLTSLWFLHDHDHLLVCMDSLAEWMFVLNATDAPR